MALAVSRRPITAEAWIQARVKPCGICGEEGGTGIGFSSSSSVSSVYDIPPSLYNLCHLGDDQYVRWWQQIRNVVSPHRNRSIKESM
jgi:hypothetical protein